MDILYILLREFRSNETSSSCVGAESHSTKCGSPLYPGPHTSVEAHLHTLCPNSADINYHICSFLLHFQSFACYARVCTNRQVYLPFWPNFHEAFMISCRCSRQQTTAWITQSYIPCLKKGQDLVFSMQNCNTGLYINGGLIRNQIRFCHFKTFLHPPSPPSISCLQHVY